MRFLIDNSLPPRMVHELVLAGHHAIHVHQLNLASADDQLIFEVAEQQQLIIISEDTDFGALLATHNSNGPSVILFRCRYKSIERLLPLLTKNLPMIAADLERGAAVVFEDTRIRIRKLPMCESG